MKTIKATLHMEYEVPDSLVDTSLSNDRKFADELEKAFWAWADKPGESRVPLYFFLKSEVKKVEDEVSGS